MPKFRGWHTILKIMRPVQQLEWSCESEDQLDVVNLWRAGRFVASEIELMQWTGKNLHGEDIYCGDIIKSSYRSDMFDDGADYDKYIIWWACAYDAWMAENIEDECCYYMRDMIYADGAKIVGNIYENPELLKERQNDGTNI